MSPRKAIENRCRHCSRTFARAEHLIRHERTHTKEKPFSCSRCPQSFARRDLLTRHQKRSHQIDGVDEGGATSSNASPRSHTPPHRLLHSSGGLVMPVLNDSPQTQASLMPAPMAQVASLDPLAWSPDGPTFPDYGLNTTMHNYVIPADMTWPDDVSGSDTLPDLDIANIRQLFFPSGQQPFVDPVDPPEAAGAQEVAEHSILSRLGSPTPAPTRDHDRTMALELQGDSTGLFAVSEQYRQFLQQQANWVLEIQLPSRATLARFVQVYFRTFHRHQPFLHEATWQSDSTAVPLFFAVCANGALYSLEIDTAFELYTVAAKLVEEDDSGISTLQTLMLVIAFAAWSGDLQQISGALRLQSRLSTLLPRCWAQHKIRRMDVSASWEEWLAHECLQRCVQILGSALLLPVDAAHSDRVTSCLFTVCNLMTLAYDFPSPVQLTVIHGLPCKEALWNAKSRGDWSVQLNSDTRVQQWASVEAIVAALGDASTACPQGVGMFACHVVISTLLQKIILFRRSCSSSFPGFAGMRHHYIHCLRRWQTMWGHEPEATLSPNHPAGPILFNCTALLRVAYIRLVIDFAPVRSVFGWSDQVEVIGQRLEEMAPIKRNSYKTRAVLHACLALKVPVNLGFEVTALSAFWKWSVQHALSYFECALLLARWLMVAQDAHDLTQEEQKVLELVVDMIGGSQKGNAADSRPSLAVAMLRRWARLLNTGPVTVWKILPKLAGVLTYYAERIDERQASVQP